MDKDELGPMDKAHSDTKPADDTVRRIDYDNWHRYAVGQLLAGTLPHWQY